MIFRKSQIARLSGIMRGAARALAQKTAPKTGISVRKNANICRVIFWQSPPSNQLVKPPLHSALEAATSTSRSELSNRAREGITQNFPV